MIKCISLQNVCKVVTCLLSMTEKLVIVGMKTKLSLDALCDRSRTFIDDLGTE